MSNLTHDLANVLHNVLNEFITEQLPSKQTQKE